MKEGVGGEGGEQSTTPIAPPLLPSAQQPRRARPVPGTRVTLQNAAALEEAQRGLEVSLRVHASRLLGLADRLLAASSAWDPTGQFFQDGTGDLERLREHEALFLAHLLTNRLAPRLSVAWTSRRVSTDGRCLIRTGQFLSPVAHLLPAEARQAKLQLISPAPGAACPPVRAVAIHFAATADQTFVLRRRLLAEPLLSHGVASLLLMPAYYGARKPERQTAHFTRTLTDFCLLTHSCIAEGCALADYVTDQLTAPGREFAGARLGLTGVSLGGAMAGVVAAMTLHPVAVSPCLGTWTGAGVYTRGGLGPQVAWRVLAGEPQVQAARGKHGGDAHKSARAWVRQVLEHNDVDVIVAALRDAPSRPPHGARSLVMCNAVDDAYVDAAEAQHLFAVLAPTCAPGDAVHRWISGGHTTAVLARTDAFVASCVESFDILERRLAANEQLEVAAMRAGPADARTQEGGSVSAAAAPRARL